MPDPLEQAVATNRRLLGLPPQDADPDAATTAAIAAAVNVLAFHGHKPPGTALAVNATALHSLAAAAVRPLIEAEAREAERQRIRDGARWLRRWSNGGWYVPADLMDGTDA